jgi:hypothetical protein
MNKSRSIIMSKQDFNILTGSYKNYIKLQQSTAKSWEKIETEDFYGKAAPLSLVMSPYGSSSTYCSQGHKTLTGKAFTGGNGNETPTAGTGDDTFAVDDGIDTVTDLSSGDALVVSAGTMANLVLSMLKNIGKDYATLGPIRISRSVSFVLLSVNMMLLSPNSYAGSHESNMKVMCKRTREVNAQGFGGEGYFYWFFNKHKLAPPSAIPSFWAEVKAHCPGAW